MLLMHTSMMLMHTSMMGYLRKDLYKMLGWERTKHFFIRCGYQAGMRDAEVTSKLRPNLNEIEAFMAGHKCTAYEAWCMWKSMN
nr:XylR N-terminal domain-containing protein [Acinetobacter piscicola]